MEIERTMLCVRCPKELRQQLADEAKAADRTLTGEIIHRLRRSLERPADLGRLADKAAA